MKSVILVFLGSGFGGIIRYILSIYIRSSEAFPLSTFLANGMACFILGIALNLIKRTDNSEMEFFRLFLIIGFCGGLSTFSSFSLETFHQLQSRDFLNFVLYSSLSFAICLASIWLGLNLTSRFI